MARFFIQQKITAFVNQYYIYDDGGDGPGQLLGFAHQKRFAFREKILFYRDDRAEEVVFEFRARQVFDFGATYDVIDDRGDVVGVFSKDFGSSLLRSTWHIREPGNEANIVVTARERSQAVAVARRVWELFTDWPFFIRFHFDFVDPRSGEFIGAYDKATLFLDKYELNVADEWLTRADWRTFVCLGVALDALQSR